MCPQVNNDAPKSKELHMKIIEISELLYIKTEQVTDVCEDGSVYDRMHACVFFEDEDLDEAALSDDEPTRKRELELLCETFKDFAGDYDAAYSKFTTWVNKIEAGV